MTGPKVDHTVGIPIEDARMFAEAAAECPGRVFSVALCALSIAHSLLALAERLNAIRATLIAAHELCRDCGVRPATVCGMDGRPLRCPNCYFRAGRPAPDTAV
jgi:hypothetical protein